MSSLSAFFLSCCFTLAETTVDDTALDRESAAPPRKARWLVFRRRPGQRRQTGQILHCPILLTEFLADSTIKRRSFLQKRNVAERAKPEQTFDKPEHNQSEPEQR